MTSRRLEIIRVAREYLQTPFHWHGRLKGVGIDCAGFPICVGRDLGLFESDFDLTEYGNYPQNMLVTLRQYCPEREIGQQLPGDILCFQFRGEPQHAGICTGDSVIHASQRWGVSEHALDRFASKIAGVFSYPGIE